MCSIFAQLAADVKGRECIQHMSMKLTAFFPIMFALFAHYHPPSLYRYLFRPLSLPPLSLSLSRLLHIHCCWIHAAGLVVNSNSNFSHKAGCNPFFVLARISIVKWTAKRY